MVSSSVLAVWRSCDRRRVSAGCSYKRGRAVPPALSKVRAPTCGRASQTLSLGSVSLGDLRCPIPKKTLSSVLACLKNVPTKHATQFPAITTERWPPTTDRYRLNISKRGRPLSANWITGTYRTSCDRGRVSAFPVRVFAIGVENSLDLSIERLHDADPGEHPRASQRYDQDQGFHCGLPFRGLMVSFRKARDEFAGVLKGDELTAGRQRHWIFETSLPTTVSH